MWQQMNALQILVPVLCAEVKAVLERKRHIYGVAEAVVEVTSFDFSSPAQKFCYVKYSAVSMFVNLYVRDFNLS